MLPIEFPAFIEASIPVWWNRERLLFVVYDESAAEIGSFSTLSDARKCWEDYCVWLSKGVKWKLKKLLQRSCLTYSCLCAH